MSESIEVKATIHQLGFSHHHERGCTIFHAWFWELAVMLFNTNWTRTMQFIPTNTPTPSQGFFPCPASKYNQKALTSGKSLSWFAKMENICLFLYWDVGEPVSYSVQSLHLEVILSPVEWLVLEQELLTLPEHLSSPSVFSEVHVTQSLVLCVCFVDRCLSLCTFSFGHCVVCPSIYGFGLPLWCLQTLLIIPQTIEAVWANSSETTTRDLSVLLLQSLSALRIVVITSVLVISIETRGSVGWAFVAHLSFCFE